MTNCLFKKSFVSKYAKILIVGSVAAAAVLIFIHGKSLFLCTGMHVISCTLYVGLLIISRGSMCPDFLNIFYNIEVNSRSFLSCLSRRGDYACIVIHSVVLLYLGLPRGVGGIRLNDNLESFLDSRRLGFCRYEIILSTAR